MSDTESAGAIYGALASIQEDLKAVGKDRQTEAKGRYMYRAAEDLVNAIHPLFRKHKVFILTDIKELGLREHRSNNGSPIFTTVAHVNFSFVSGVDGSRVTCCVPGEAMDMQDKGSGKAMTYALKTALSHLFTVPTEDWADTEAYSYELQSQDDKVFLRAQDAIRNATTVSDLEAIVARIETYRESGALADGDADTLRAHCTEREKDLPKPDANSGRRAAQGE